MNKEQMIFELKDSIARLIDSKKLFPSMAEAIDKKIAAYDEIAMMLNVQEPFKNAYIQVVKERDITIGQLNELGYSLGEKIRPCDKESENKECRGCHYNDGEPHAECVVCDKAESEENKQ